MTTPAHGQEATNQDSDTNDPNRVWTDIGGDLEASYDGVRYVDIRIKGSGTTRLFASRSALEAALRLMDVK